MKKLIRLALVAGGVVWLGRKLGFFSGKQLSASDFEADQQYRKPHRP